MKIPNQKFMEREKQVSLARIVSEDSQLFKRLFSVERKSSKDS